MVVLVTYKNEEDPFKNEGARVVNNFSHCKSIGIFQDAQGQLSLPSMVGSGRNLNLSELFMVVLVTYKNEEDPIKCVSVRVVITLYIDILDAHVQLNP